MLERPNWVGGEIFSCLLLVGTDMSMPLGWGGGVTRKLHHKPSVVSPLLGHQAVGPSLWMETVPDVGCEVEPELLAVREMGVHLP